MKLYFTKGACSLACRIIINELSIDCHYESVNLKTKKTESGADFLKINDKGAVPTLTLDDNKVLTENSAILQYLADNFNGKHLLPQVPTFERYQVLSWLNYVATDLHKGIGILFYPLKEELKEQLRMMVEKKLDYVNACLAQRRYLLGEAFTLPDAYLFVMLSWAISFEFKMEKWPNLIKFYTNLKQRPSIQKSLAQENIQLKEYDVIKQ